MTIPGSHASLADVLARSSGGPVPVPIAVQLVIAAARALEAMPGRPLGLATTHIALDRAGFVVVVPGAMRAAYGAPEMATFIGLDARSDVFSLGVILWEMLAGRPLFERGSEQATVRAVLEDAVPDIRSQNTEVPAMVADVLASALPKSPEGRFDSVTAFGRALAGARAASGLPEPTNDDVARWLTKRLAQPPLGSQPSVPNLAPSLGNVGVPDLDLPGSSRAHRSGQMPATAPASVRTAAAAAFSDLHLVAAPASLPPQSSRQPPSLREPSRPSVPSRPSAPSNVPAHGIDLDLGDSDDFDMEIERNMASSGLPSATSSRPSGLHTDGPTSRASRPTGSGLALGAPSRLLDRPQRTTARVREVGFFAKLLGVLVAFVLLGGTAFGLFRFVHHAGGRSLTAPLPHAFDGTSANESGAVALVALVVAVVVIFAGLRLRPHAWMVVLSGAALLLLALAMVTVTLASTGESPTPPDGVLLVPYLAPAALALFALGLGARAGRVFARAYGARKLGGVPLAVIAGGIAFVAFEFSRFAGRF